VPALLLAGAASAQSAGRTNPADPQANVPPVEYRSAFEGYRSFAEKGLRDWRRSNDEVGAVGGQVGEHRAGQSPRRHTSKPQPGKPESSRAPAEKRPDVPAHLGHGEHK